MKYFFLVLLLPFISISVWAQFDVSMNYTLNVGADGYNGNGASFYDFNDDGYDDVTLAGANGVLKFFLSNGNGTFEEVYLGIEGDDGDHDAKQVIWVDFDNDGDSDFFVTYFNDPCRLWRNDGNLAFTDISATSGITQTSSWQTYGSAWGDYDRDGFLDVYLTNYNISGGVTNYLFHNNGDGTFTNVTSTCNCSDGVQNSFQSLWFDYDNDNWLDLVVINDRIIYPNDILRNNGDGTFTSKGEELGFDQMIYAMSITCGDYDNDDDFDIYVSNGLEGNIFMQYDEESGFTDIAPDFGMTVNDVCWGALWIDFDNNQWQDLLVSNYTWGIPESENFFFVNELGENFNADNSIIGNSMDNAYAPTLGDLTNDGYPDVVLHTLTNSSTHVLHNQGGANHFLKIGLEGTISNKDGVGSLIEVWSGGIKQKRFTYCGENYLGQSSHYEFIGLGANDLVDSIKVTWPSGIIDALFETTADQTINIIEGQSFQIAINWDGPVCEDQTTELSIDVPNGSIIEWNNGSDQENISVIEPGTYAVMVTNDLGLVAYDTLEVVFNPLPVAASNITHVTCAGWNDGMIELFNVSGVPITDVIWNEGDYNGLNITGLSGGLYSFTMIDENGCSKYGEATVNEPQELIIDLEIEQPNCYGELGNVLATASGGTGNLTIDWGLAEDGADLLAGNYTATVTDESSCSTEISFSILEPAELQATIAVTDANDGNNGSATISISGGTEPYTIQWSNGDAGTVADELSAGVYTVLITDANGCIINESFSLIDLSVGNEWISHCDVYASDARLIIVNESLASLFFKRYESSGRLLEEGSLPPNGRVERTLYCTHCVEFVQIFSIQGSTTFKIKH